MSESWCLDPQEDEQEEEDGSSIEQLNEDLENALDPSDEEEED